MSNPSTPANRPPAQRGELDLTVGMTGGMLDVKNASDLMMVARAVAKSRLKPHGLETAEDCFLVMFYGQMYGFQPAEALQALHVVKGKVCAGGETVAGLIQSRADCREYRTWVEGEGDERAGCVQSWRQGREKANDVVRFTLGQARRAGLYDEKWRDRNNEPSVWVKYTDDQLIWKAVARDKRRNWPDAHRKLDVLEDLAELREVRDVTPRPVRVAIHAEQPAGVDPLLALDAPAIELDIAGGATGEPARKTEPEVPDLAGSIAQESPADDAAALALEARLADLGDACDQRAQHLVDSLGLQFDQARSGVAANLLRSAKVKKGVTPTLDQVEHMLRLAPNATA